MSSSLDQRSSKSHEIHDENIASNKETGYEYGPDSQTAYNAAQMGQNADPYFYWHHYHANPGGSMQEGSWSDREGMYGGYGPMPNHHEYMNPGMYAGYDYSYSWYPNVDPSSAGSWNQQNHYYKRNDYPNGSYYGEPQVDESGEVSANNDYNGDSNGGVQAAEQSFKNMSLSGDAEKDVSNRLSSSGAPAGKKSWANVVNQQPSRSTIPRTSRAIPKAPLAPGWEKGVPSKYSQNSSSRPMAGEGRQVYGGPYSSGGFKPSLAHYGGDAGGDSGNYKTTTNNPITSSSGAGTGGCSAPVPCNFNPNDYNPKDFDLNPKAARFFVIKSFSEDDIHRSIKYSIWCSTEYGNKRLDAAYREREGKGQVFLYFSVNGSGHFCGVAQMTSSIDYSSSSEVWAQNKWKGQFSVKWIYVKDVPNSQLRHIKLENNENKPVTNSRDTQEVPYEKGKQVLRIIHQYRHTTSIFDDFYHYEKQQEDAQHRK